MVNVLRVKMLIRIVFFFKEIWDWRKIGIGIRMIIMLDEMLKMVFVIR